MNPDPEAGMKALASAALVAMTATMAEAQEGEKITIEGEIIDTWCYFSGVMGGPEAVVGSAHHTCALWCSAGGIPVGLLAPDGTVYMVLKLPGTDRNRRRRYGPDAGLPQCARRGAALRPRRAELHHGRNRAVGHGYHQSQSRGLRRRAGLRDPR